MLPTSHVVPINGRSVRNAHSPGMLADAFSEFISASSQLEASYRDLQQEVSHLGTELADRNAALTRSLAKNDRMRGELQQIIDSMPCGVVVSDTSDAITTINPEARRLLELGDARVRNLRELSIAGQIDFGRMATETEGPCYNELCLSSAAGKRWLAIGNRKLIGEDEEGKSSDSRNGLQSVWILRDVTASKLAEREREAARNSMALAEMSTILAHEIRNPLASMELFAGLIAEEPEQTKEWVSHLLAGIRQLSGTVNNVLSMQSGGRAHLVPVNLCACVGSGVEFVRPIAEQASVRLDFACSEGNPRILGNENMVRQILLNLICNAIHHTPAGGRIEVTAGEILLPGQSSDGATDGAIRTRVAVSDTGCGIAPEQMHRIFEAGFSASGDTPGMGLAVCKRLMQQHGGEIRAFNRVNGGSTFELEFPTI